ncbi:MAG: hypothetical protein ABR597_02750 [Bacteroidales bacterium]
MKKEMKRFRLNSVTEILHPATFAFRIFKSSVGLFVLLAVMILSSCEKDEFDPFDKPDTILPDRFKVEIPSSISSAYSTKDGQVDTLQGNDIYRHLRTFISVGESGAELAQNIMLTIAALNLNRPMELTYISDDDGRTKNLKIVENVQYEEATWHYRMTISDIEDGTPEMGMQVFWRWDPLVGIAILNPYNIDRNTEEIFTETTFRIDYSEAGNLGYDAHMFVSFSGFPLPNPLQNPYGLDKMKMFVGKTGDQVTVFGNSSHPNAKFFNNETGFNWAFVAAADENLDIAVAEVGLPPSDLDAADRETLLETYSIYNVFHDQIMSVWPTIDPEILNAYLYNTQAPGYFNQNGFVQAGTGPSEDYLPLKDYIQNLAPYNPASILNMNIEFDN